MKYVQYAGFISNLTDKLADIDTDLPIHDQHLALLAQRLGGDGYTYLKAMDGTNVEYFRVINLSGKIAIDVRGLEKTTAHTFPVGTCIKWEITPMAVRDIVCQMPCCEEED